MKTCSDHPQNKCKIKKKNTDIKRNRISALLIVLTLSLSAPVVAISGYDDNNINGAVDETFTPLGSTLTYKITSEDPKEVSVVISSDNSIVNLTIPASVTHPDTSVTYSVKSIGANVFQGHMFLTTVNMNSIENIGNYAFAFCYFLETVHMNSAEVIGESAFFACGALEIVNMDAAKTIGKSAFYGCTSLETVNIDAVTTLGMDAFYSCTNLETVNMNSIEIISAGAFSGCISLKTVNIDSNNAYFEIYDRMVYNKGRTEVILCPPALPITLYTSPSSVVTIGYNAFDSCANLETVVLSSVKALRGGAFMSCTSLKTVEMGSVRTVGGNAFRECTGLTTINMDSVETVGKFVFYGCTNLETVNMNSSENIGEGMFFNCTTLKTVNASFAKTVGADAFSNCTSLEIVVLREGTSTVGANIRASAIIIFSDQNIKINAERVSGDTNGDDLEIIITARAGYELIGEPVVRTIVDDLPVLINYEGGGAWGFHLPAGTRSVIVTQSVLEIEDLDPSSDPGVSPDLPSWAWILVVAIVLAVVIVIYVMYVRRK